MEKFGEQESAFGSSLPPPAISLTPFNSPSPRRLSSCYAHRTALVRAKRQLAWVDLRGRLVGVEEATAVKTIDRNRVLSDREVAAWEMFTPIQRVLIVAIVAAAAVNARKNQRVLKLERSVDIRDQVLQTMQQKMDSLFLQARHLDNHSQAAPAVDFSVTKRIDCGCVPCQYHALPLNHALGNTSIEGSKGDKAFEYSIPVAANVAEAEERRVSDLSDWAPSVESSVDNPNNDINMSNPTKKINVSIDPLSALFQSSDVCRSKRIAELEDIVGRKSLIINKLWKEITILEEKVMNLTRARRPSFLAASSNVKQLPLMVDNILYDMDSTTSPSSDPDISPRNHICTPASESQDSPFLIRKKISTASPKCSQFKSQKALVTSPLRESSTNRTPNSVPSMRSRHSPSGENHARRRPPIARSREVTTPKRWL